MATRIGNAQDEKDSTQHHLRSLNTAPSLRPGEQIIFLFPRKITPALTDPISGGFVQDWGQQDTVVVSPRVTFAVGFPPASHLQWNIIERQ